MELFDSHGSVLNEQLKKSFQIPESDFRFESVQMKLIFFLAFFRDFVHSTSGICVGITMPKQGVLENVIVPKKICLELVHLALTTQKMVQFLQHLVPYKQNILFKSNFDKYCEFLSEKIILEKNRMSKKVEKLEKCFRPLGGDKLQIFGNFIPFGL